MLHHAHYRHSRALAHVVEQVLHGGVAELVVVDHVAEDVQLHEHEMVGVDAVAVAVAWCCECRGVDPLDVPLKGPWALFRQIDRFGLAFNPTLAASDFEELGFLADHVRVDYERHLCGADVDDDDATEVIPGICVSCVSMITWIEGDVGLTSW